jgi:hypothetical protein
LAAVPADDATPAEARGTFLTSPMAPRGEMGPLGGMFTPSCTPRGEQRISHLEDNFTPRGQNSHLGDNFAHGGQSLPLGVKLSPVLLCTSVPNEI